MKESMEHGYYWYVERGKTPTVVRVDGDGVQFTGNDEYYQVGEQYREGGNVLTGVFSGPLAPPTK